MLVSKTLEQKIENKKENNVENNKIAACHLNEVIKQAFMVTRKG